jgi:ABC-type amino acid transport substrate-binding protein
MKNSLVLAGLVSLVLVGNASMAQDRSDPRVQSGVQFAPSGDDVNYPDAISRIQGTGVIRACADSHNFPGSAMHQEPPGYDIDIIRAIAARRDMRVEFVWADTGTRGGLGRAMRNTIDKKLCDVFVGLPIAPDMLEEMKEKNYIFTRPYLSDAYVLVVQGKAADMKSLAELKAANLKVGVDMSTPADAYLFDREIPRELYFRNRAIMRGLANGEVDAALVWSPRLIERRKEAPKADFKLADGFVPEPALRWNSAMIVPEKEKGVKEFLDAAIDEMVANGEIGKIVTRYGLPYFPPVN